MAISRRRKKTTGGLSINAQSFIPVKTLAQLHVGLTSKKYVVKPTVSDLIRTAIEAVCLSTAAQPFQSDLVAVGYLKAQGIHLILNEEDLEIAKQAEALRIVDADLSEYAALIPPTLAGTITPLQLKQLVTMMERGDKGESISEVAKEIGVHDPAAQMELPPGCENLPPEAIEALMREQARKLGVEEPHETAQKQLDQELAEQRARFQEAGIIAEPKRTAVEGELVEEDPEAAKMRQLAFLQKMREAKGVPA
jgi:hypothetical protein